MEEEERRKIVEKEKKARQAAQDKAAEKERQKAEASAIAAVSESGTTILNTSFLKVWPMPLNSRSYVFFYSFFTG